MRDRRTGALEAVAQADRAPTALREIPTERLDVAAGRDARGQTARVWPSGPPPSSAPTTCWPSACSSSCTRPGVKVPDDLAIVGYDDIEFAAAATVPLTSVRQPARAMGATGRRPASPGSRRPGGRAPSPARRAPTRVGRPRFEPARSLRPAARPICSGKGKPDPASAFFTR
ncbi:substrate-binding domain-containing protein [Streptomyces thinghirensis]|nr:substrate-binding domain-containing protein [Streptomyces thinghirensis]